MIIIRWSAIKLKRRLSKERKIILKKLKELKAIPDFGSELDPDIETDESEEFSNQLAQAQVLKGRLADIEIALSKIGKGTYGICENCKKEISPEILKIVPESRLCKECKQKIH
ncbi:MAG: TraR/DksA family transcriptional regulator [Candidatus Paceibacterota bacterium]|jgi:RNA polymerase-binding transcription factor DksA